jgi:hypothetical protein
VIRNECPFINDRVTTISGHFFCHLYVHLSQNWGSDGHFEVLNRSKPQLYRIALHLVTMFFLQIFTLHTRVQRSDWRWAENTTSSKPGSYVQYQIRILFSNWQIKRFSWTVGKIQHFWHYNIDKVCKFIGS